MKRIAAMLSAALVLSLAAPAFAAVEFGGKLATEFELHKVADEWVIDGKTGLEIETEVRAEGGDPIKAVVELSPWRFESGFDDDGDPEDPFENPPSLIALSDLSIKKAWIETQGAYWNGGPAVSTRLGDVDVKWNDYVGYLDERRGITVQGLPVGPSLVSAFYAWDTDDDTRPYGVSASANIEGVDLSGILVRKADETNYAFGAGMSVMPGIDVKGALALDGQSKMLYRAEATAEGLIEGVKVTAAYRHADEDFRPAYTIPAEDEDGDTIGTGHDIADRNHEDNVNYDLRTGFSVSAETTQSGVHMVASYDQPTEVAKFKADTEVQGFKLAGEAKMRSGKVEKTELEVGKNLTLAGFDVETNYKAVIKPGNDVEHKISAESKTDLIAQLQGLSLAGEVKLVGSDVSWNTSAKYTAPNGLNLGAKYDSVEGASATAGVKVEF